MTRQGGELAVERIAVDAAGAAVMFDLGERTWRRHDAAGLVPQPVRLGGAVRWPVDELQAWAAAGCPPRHKWAQMKGNGR